MLDLRPYQRQALDKITTLAANGTRRPLVVHPTGSGKTVTFSHLIATYGKRTLVLVHRDELVSQTVAKLGLIAPELRVGVVKADRDEVDADVVIASVQTVHRDFRLARLAGFELIVVDEAHHVDAPTWKKVLTHLGAFDDDGPLTVGFTATPERDGRKLGVWQDVAHFRSIRAMIADDYLVPVIGQTVSTSANLDAVTRARGDFTDGGLADELERSGAIDEIADAWQTYAADRKTIAFTPTVATAHALAEAVRARGGAAESVWGAQPTDERRAVLHRLHTGETMFVANAAVLTEGFDEPSVDCVLIARPTSFHGLYIQQVGRGLRKHPGKANCLVLDVTGASERHDLATLVDLGLAIPKAVDKEPGAEAGSPCPICRPAECRDPQAHTCRLCRRPLSASVIVDGGDRHVNCRATKTASRSLLTESKLRWLRIDDGFVIGLQDGVLVIAPVDDDGELWQLATYERGKIEVLHSSLPLEWAQGIGEDQAKAFGKLTKADARWLEMPPTERQLSRLHREGLPETSLGKVQSRGHAADLITRLAGRRALRRLATWRVG